MAVVGLIQDDNVADFVFRDMHKELIRQINVDEITVHLTSAGMLTDVQQDTLQNSRRGATDRTKYLLSNEVLGGRGFSGLMALTESLRGNALFKPHLELADKVETCYLSRIRRSQNMRSLPMSVNSQQSADPRTGESCGVSPSSAASNQSDNRSLRGDPTHRSRFRFTSPAGEYLVETASGVKPKSPSPATDDGDVYSSCQSELSDDDNDDATSRHSTDHPNAQGLPISNEVMILQKHRSLKNALAMKIILVGNSSVGKTSVIYRFIHGKYVKSVPTCGTGYSYQYVYHPKKNVNVKMLLWDTMGQERHHSITSTFYKNSDVAVIVFDLTSPESLNHVHWWHKELKDRVYPERDIPIILAGNKFDLMRHNSIRQPSIMTKARQKAFDLGLKDFIVVSARNGCGMEELFGRAVTLGLEKSHEQPHDTITLHTDDAHRNDNNNNGSKCFKC